MEEKKGTKVSLTGAILFFVVLVIIGAMAFVYSAWTQKTEREELQKQIATLEQEKQNLESDKLAVEEKLETVKTAVNDKDDKEELIKLLEEIQTNEAYSENVFVEEVKKQGNNYFITAGYYKPVTINQSRYEKMRSEGKIVFEDIEYTFKNDNGTEFISNLGYGYIVNSDKQGYWIEKNNEGYIFTFEIGGVTTYINYLEKSFKLNLDKDTKVFEYPKPNDEDLTIQDMDWTDEFIKNSRITIELDDGELCLHRDVR